MKATFHSLKYVAATWPTAAEPPAAVPTALLRLNTSESTRGCNHKPLYTPNIHFAVA